MTLPPQPIVTSAAIVNRIQARLSGELSDKALAGWAFERFYAEELGNEAYETGAEVAIADALDALMFADDPGFRLVEKELRDMVVQLSTL